MARREPAPTLDEIRGRRSRDEGAIRSTLVAPIETVSVSSQKGLSMTAPPSAAPYGRDSQAKHRAGLPPRGSREVALVALLAGVALVAAACSGAGTPPPPPRLTRPQRHTNDRLRRERRDVHERRARAAGRDARGEGLQAR